MLNRQAKLKNTIFYNVPEVMNERDNTSVLAIIQSLPDCNVSKFYCRRIGKRIEGKIRPILVKFHSEGDAKLVLSKKDKANPPIKIKNDLTPMQIKELKLLRADLDEWNAKNPDRQKTIQYIDHIPKIVFLEKTRTSLPSQGEKTSENPQMSISSKTDSENPKNQDITPDTALKH